MDGKRYSINNVFSKWKIYKETFLYIVCIWTDKIPYFLENV